MSDARIIKISCLYAKDWKNTCDPYKESEIEIHYWNSSQSISIIHNGNAILGIDAKALEAILGMLKTKLDEQQTGKEAT